MKLYYGYQQIDYSKDLVKKASFFTSSQGSNGGADLCFKALKPDEWCRLLDTRPVLSCNALVYFAA